MARKSRRSSSRKMKHTRKHKTHRSKRGSSHRRSTRRRGGADALSGASVNYHLSGSWPSKMSLGQGADYFKYHEGQHGGAALGMGQYPAAVLSGGLPAALRGPAHIGGIDKAIADVAGLKDQAGGKRRRNNNGEDPSPLYPNDNGNSTGEDPTVGGRRRRSHHKRHTKRHHKSRRHSKKHRKSHRRSHRNKRRSGGALGYAPFPSTGMLLSGPMAYAQAGLNPEWKTDVAFEDAKIREGQ